MISSNETGTHRSRARGLGVGYGPGHNTARNALRGLWGAMGAMVLGAIACTIHPAMVSIIVPKKISLFVEDADGVRGCMCHGPLVVSGIL